MASGYVSSAQREKVVAVCDPVSTGGAIAAMLSSRGYSMIRVWSSVVTPEFKEHIPSVAKDLLWLGEISEQATTEETCTMLMAMVGDRQLEGVIVGGETGVILADELSEALGLRTNGTSCKGRRDKSEQQKLVKVAGLRSTREASGKELSDVRAFLESEPMPCIVKPTESCGSDGVKKCSSIEEAEEHFKLLMRSQKKAGAQDGAVICQEFLAGQEYVVDHVSRDGVHKTVMVWVYDKRPTNGGEFVYYNMLPVEASNPTAQVLIEYTRGVLDALDIKNGPTHAEVMMTSAGTPCLVEMNCRAHGWDGAWAPLERALVGYSQVEAACDSYFDAEAFDALPNMFPPFMAGGQMVELVSNFSGRITGLPGYDVIKALPSFDYMEVGSHIAVGQDLALTIDLFTCAGAVILCHPSSEQVAEDEATIRRMELDGSLFELSSKHDADADSDALLSAAEIKTERVVAVCDPVSTGGAIAAMLSNRGFQMIKVWSSDVTPEFKEHVPSVAKDMPWLAEVSEQETIEETCNELRRFVGDRELVGVVVGAETGVILADELSEALGLRTNGTICKGRRNKSEQQKLVKAAGLRSTREASGTLLSEVREFLENEPMPCIVKPTESCGSDGVKKCKSIEEAEAHFELLMRSQKKAGAQNGAVICQEFLAGQEYVVDHVSRDGVHKTVMVWVYDKRPTNGGEFVYYNMLPVESSDPTAKILIDYTRGVIDALDIKNGPTHAEVMMTSDGTPCLVEMNCRAHGWDGAWAPLERALVGYSQVEAACDSYFDGEAFDALPDMFPTFKAGGQMVELVSNFSGRITGLPGYDVIKALPSFDYMEVGSHIAVGQELALTIDLFTCAGAVILCHPDRDQVAQDEATIRRMELDGSLFQLDDK